MRVSLDEAKDLATIYFSEERQTEHGGSTCLVVVNDEEHPRPVSVDVQLGFEDNQRLLWMTVRPASQALPPDLLARAERIG